MPMLPFGDYRPDLSAYQGASSQVIQNVVPRGDGYGPFADFTPFTSALPAACRGFFYARKTDGSIAVFAGTASKLYQLSNTDLSWTDVSRSGGTYTALPSSDHWQFAQFGNLVIAVEANTVPQVFDLTSSTAFADLAGSPPQARYIAVVGRFVVLSGLLSTPYRIQWSGLNAVTTWTSGINSSDFQDLPDGGIMRGVAGGEYGVIFQETAMRRMVYVPGSPVIFNIERITEDKGLMAPYSLIRAADKIFFLSPQGFQGMISTGAPAAIGKERFDRTFFADYDSGSIQMIIGAADPAQTRIYWAYKSSSGTTGQFDKVLCYDYALDRASIIGMRARAAWADAGEPRCHFRLARCAGVLARRRLDGRAVEALGRWSRAQARVLHRRQSGGDARHGRADTRWLSRAGEGVAPGDGCRDLLRLGRRAREPAERGELQHRAVGERPWTLSCQCLDAAGARAIARAGEHGLDLCVGRRARLRTGGAEVARAISNWRRLGCIRTGSSSRNGRCYPGSGRTVSRCTQARSWCC
jgi:hypothetical protein